VASLDFPPAPPPAGAATEGPVVPTSPPSTAAVCRSWAGRRGRARFVHRRPVPAPEMARAQPPAAPSGCPLGARRPLCVPRRVARASPLAGANRFPFNNFKFFELSFQSPLHLSLTVLVRYRPPAVCLALGGVYHPFQAALPSSPTRRMRPSYGRALCPPRFATGISPSRLHLSM